MRNDLEGTIDRGNPDSIASRAQVERQDLRAIAKEAFVYGFPLVEAYKTLYAQALDTGGKDFKAPFNTIGNTARVFTPDDTAFVTPNADTPYSFLWADLRAEPLVLSVPKIDDGRYYSLQFVDLFTQNFAYVGTRSTGQGGGKYLLAGPSWHGGPLPGISDVLKSETEFVYVVYRTQLFNADDLENVKGIQARYTVQTLSSFLDRPAPKAAPRIDWPAPEPHMTETVRFFKYLAFLLQFAPTHPSEIELRQRLALIGVEAGKLFDERTLSAEIRSALADGIDDGWREYAAFKKSRLDTQQVSSGDIFGSRAFLRGNYLYRFAAAKLGIFGNSREEALYPAYFVDAKKQPLDASAHEYVLVFSRDNVPPALSFWSLTIYDAERQLLVPNKLNRYLINSGMQHRLVQNADGGFTIYVQKESPGAANESNWLPAPDGPFYLVLRIYRPKPEAYNGRWQRPALQRTT